MKLAENNVFTRIKKVFSRERPVETPVVTVIEEPARDDIRKKLEQDFQTRLDNIQGISQNDETLVITVNTHIMATSEGYYRVLGLADGQIGSRDYQILSSATTHAERITSLVRSKVSGRIQELGGSVKDQERQLADKDAVCSHSAEVLSEIEEEEREDDKSFNKMQAWMYILFGLFMILSDVAVSLNLVNFFGIGDNAKEGTGLWSKLTDGELLLFSLGIAFCTVYVKILYDDYINTRAGSGYVLQQNLVKKGMSVASLKMEAVFKGVIKVIILIGLLWFLFSLAQFRAFHTKNDINAVHDVSSSSDAESIGDTEVNKNEIAEDKQKGIEQDRYLLYSFIGLSLMVPLISGISLSVGFRILQRNRMLDKARSAVDIAREERAKCYAELKNLISREAEFSAFFKDWERADSKITNIATFFANLYQQGYREGYRSYYGNDLYVLVEEYRNELINQAFSKTLTKL